LLTNVTEIFRHVFLWRLPTRHAHFLSQFPSHTCMYVETMDLFSPVKNKYIKTEWKLHRRERTRRSTIACDASQRLTGGVIYLFIFLFGLYFSFLPFIWLYIFGFYTITFLVTLRWIWEVGRRRKFRFDWVPRGILFFLEIFEKELVSRLMAVSLFDLLSVSCKFTFTFLDGFWVCFMHL
jgi:hypothetical protein